MSSENREETADKLGTLKKWQVVADIIAKLAVPVALAFVSYMVTASMKEQDVRVKMTEVALDVLKEAPNPKATEADEALRRWAVDLIDAYSSVKLPQSVRAQLAVNAFPS